ncbi:hypothetical protein [Vulgatibacter sp.]|uniref:hypothetical protein n=1 Tax=Vulgatibacter sp. TaxID=1971226 RepID=UPI00356972DF
MTRSFVTTATAIPAPLDAPSLQREAAASLAEALAQANVLHQPGVRDRHRRLLEQAIELAVGALQGADEATIAAARLTLVKAHAARAQDARHGAGQISLGSQRAPTRAACDDGWERVESIVAVAEASAAEARRQAALLGRPAAYTAARAAEAAAREARRIVDERNHAYTFHADPGFSFGEGWYLAASGLLAGVAIQIEPDQKQTAQAERFLLDAGLGSRLQPYRSRPRANKHLTEIVAQAFRADALAAQATLRAAFLGGAPIPQPIIDWIDSRLAGAPAQKKVLLWVRYGAHDAHRNTTWPEIAALSERARTLGLVPVLIGDALRDGPLPTGALDLTLFWKEPLFQGFDMRRAQLQLFEHLKTAHRLVGQLGVTTAGMDGPALLGLPTMYLTQQSNVRMREWVGAIPGYEEVVRGDDFLERITATLRRWA